MFWPFLWQIIWKNSGGAFRKKSWENSGVFGEEGILGKFGASVLISFRRRFWGIRKKSWEKSGGSSGRILRKIMEGVRKTSWAKSGCFGEAEILGKNQDLLC